ncbi:hypothetical protein N7462_002068 [Penicillium macrosclerotiorum]|uniref:uncharacterized protein n=1 Tax=Penicillium macrosclerotiorum TaxID=303699 RepID=UPI0025499674|nr:uncharacterized protein N7462_002068 [Penicillium macrosclerotiorum]KAJ5692645.1 hypothetical protein N7462_002068 [Penicillium macrosclerotiorum]
MSTGMQAPMAPAIALIASPIEWLLTLNELIQDSSINSTNSSALESLHGRLRAIGAISGMFRGWPRSARSLFRSLLLRSSTAMPLKAADAHEGGAGLLKKRFSAWERRKELNGIFNDSNS